MSLREIMLANRTGVTPIKSPFRSAKLLKEFMDRHSHIPSDDAARILWGYNVDRRVRFDDVHNLVNVYRESERLGA